MQYGLIGEKLGHSYSKQIHESLGLYSYELVELRPDELAGFMEVRDFAGINVTIPYKQAVIPYLDELTECARAVGAVNTVVNRRGRLIGGNTDFGGMRALIRRSDMQLAGKRVLIAGTGGTSMTAEAVMRTEGVQEVWKASRTGRAGALTYEQAYASHDDVQVLVNTTPVGMWPNADDVPVDLARLPHLQVVIDAAYNPSPTRLVQEARGRGILAEDGLGMLVAQAALSAEAFLAGA